MRQLLIQSADMLHYTKSLLSYLTSQVGYDPRQSIEPGCIHFYNIRRQISSAGWLKYRHILQSSRSLAEHATVIQYILTTFNHILRFVRQVDEFVSAVDRNMQKYFPDYCSDEDSDQLATPRVGKAPSVRLLEHPDFRSLESELARSSREFKRQSHFLVVMLTAMQKHGASPHVNEIVTQLNYNYFYHQQESRSRTQPQVQQQRPVKQVNQAQALPLNRSRSLRPPPAPKKFSRTGSVPLS
ncbi:hypothetical protein AM587_10013160 [Phytophthora nicotianae]|uniref:Gamma tubulin complex component C-terminal domain-containing protein n=1 Tax=Phytophthora nicotianae TaxID=4792 RepID=A0A0W8BZP5_PHYNI|nr:hypothetical protein AM587_10013160 [Phytophthora nicotianae]